MQYSAKCNTRKGKGLACINRLGKNINTLIPPILCFLFSATLYRSTIAPGVEDRAKELKSLTASATDAQGMATQVNTLIEGVQTDVTAVQAATESLGSEAARLQASLLEAVGTLQVGYAVYERCSDC